MNDIIFTDTSNGWAVHTGNGAILSTNSGFTWQIISFNDTSFTTSYNGVFFINNLTGWAAGGALQIRKTTNGGASWFKQYSAPAAGVLNNIYFFNNNTGIAIGRKNASLNSYVEKTTSGGLNWTEIIATTANNNELHDQFWFDLNTGWISGRNTLLKSTNGGLNWVNLYSNIPATQNGQNELLAIWFVNQQTGWVGASNLDKKNIYKTTDAGSSWVFQNNPVTQNQYVQINDLRFLTPDSGWAVHGTPVSGAIMFTTNGGNNWIIEEGSNNWFDCIYNYARYKAWCGSEGKVWYTYLQSPMGLKNTNNKVPVSYVLYQNYPNPFNPVTTIEFDAAEQSEIELSIFDVTGRKIETLINSVFGAGKYKFDFHGDNYSSGIYFYQLKAAEFIETRKMTILK
jgi:photosystem II stability/assembly factor-like uncharacterized protein